MNQTYERDGIVYHITTESGEGGYYGKWHCTTCNINGASNHRDATEQEAVRGAEVNTGGHHFAKHRQ